MRSKFVAIRQHEVIDTDVDGFVLARRVGKKFPGQVVLIEKVELTDRRIELPSMELR
jgi:hypothetical protein